MPGILKTVRVHYRHARLDGAEPEFTLQQRLNRVMMSVYGGDARERVVAVTDDGQHKGCLNYSEAGKEAFVADIMHLDGRDVLPTWVHPTAPQPVAEVVPRALADGEASLGEPVYILVRGNHVAAIERLGFRTTNLQRYINGLLKVTGELEIGAEWKLVPKVEVVGSSTLGGGVKKIVVRPHAALAGDGPPQEIERTAEGKRQKRGVSKKMEDLLVRGQRVIDLLIAAGADEAKIEKLREKLSNDLVLRARLEISVTSKARKTSAEIAPDVVQQALADLTLDGDVMIVSGDGQSDGKLVQLTHSTQVLETGGLIDWQRATYALTSAITTWAAQGLIELSP